MEQLGTIVRAVCMGACICGIGVAVLAAIVLGIAGGGLITTIKDILGIGQRDEDELIDKTLESIHEKRTALQNRRSRIVGDGGIPDFDAAVAKYAGDSTPPNRGGENFSAQSLDDPKHSDNLGGLGSARRFGNTGNSSGGSLRKRNDRNRDYEIYDDGDFDDGGLFGD